jgi:tetratricopeptide (TPR) repeat protein
LEGYESARTYPIYLYHYGYDLGRAALNEKFERTSHLLKRQIREDPGNYWHHLNLAVAYASNFMFREAIIEGKAALDLAAKKGYTDHNVLWACYIVSSALFKLADYESAEQYALQAAKLSSDHLDSYFMLVLVYHKQKDWEKLLEAARKFLEIQKALKESPQEFAYMILNSANEEWRVRLALADLYLHTENRQLAVAEFKKALAVTPNQSECHRVMGDIYRDKGFLDKAEVCLRRALKLSPDSIETLTILGHLYFEKGDFQSAINPYERAVQLVPGLMDVSLRLATVYLFQGNPDGCVAQCDSMLKSLNLPRNLLLNSLEDLALVFLTIAKSLTKEAQTHLAKEAVQIAVRLAPELVNECEKDPEMIESAFQGSGT